MRTPRPDGRVTIQLHLEPDLVARLDAAADERVLGRRRLIELLLEQGLAKLAPVDQLTARGGMAAPTPPRFPPARPVPCVVSS